MGRLGAVAILLFSTLAFAQTQGVMTTAGSAAVSESGAMTYTIPIQIVPGTMGIEPKLALAYNSQGGNGLLGMGWSLSGLSAISRCPGTTAQDGFKGSINFDANDRFCLDGMRLLAVSGAYGVDGTEYRTEQENFSKIVSYGSAGNGPAWFKVWTKSGQVIEFGNTADSRIEAQGKTTARAWALNKLSDTLGNYFTVGYTENTNTGEHYPVRIDYTGNDRTGNAPNTSVQFSYENRNDVIRQYLGGSVLASTLRLRAIQTYSGATGVMKYSLSYANGTATQRSQLSSIAACNLTDNTCLPANQVIAQDTSTTIPSPKYSDVALPARIGGAAGNVYYPYGNPGQQFLADFNGDGRTDYMFMPANGDGRWLIAYATGNGFTVPNYDNPALPARVGGYSTNNGGFLQFVADFNGDGMADYMWIPYGTNDRWLVAYGTATGFKLDPNTPALSGRVSGAYYAFGNSGMNYIADFNGDGRADYMFMPANGDGRWLIAYATGNGFTSPNYATPALPASVGAYSSNNGGFLQFVADFNGDGMADFMWIPYGTNDRWLVAYGTESGFRVDPNTPALSGRVDGIYYAFGGGSTANYVADFNGDGRADYMFIPANGDGRWLIAYATGNGFTAPSYATPALAAQVGGYSTNNGGFLQYVADFNGDGMADFMWIPYGTNDRWLIAYGTPTGFRVDPSTPSLSGRVDGIYLAFGNPGCNFVADFSGDGRADYLFIPANGDGRWLLASKNEPTPDLVTKIVPGIGSGLAISYSSLVTGSAYLKGSGSVYPLADLQNPMTVVSSVATSNGVGGTLTTNYKYGGLKAEIGTGRGLLGFAWTEATQVETGMVTRNEYRQDFPYTGLVSRTVLSKPGAGNGGLLKETTNSYACLDPASTTGASCTLAPGKRYFPVASQTVDKSWDLDGSVLPVLTTSTAFDCGTPPYACYGNAVGVTVNNADGSSKTTTNLYSNDVSNWRLGRLLRSTVTSTTP